MRHAPFRPAGAVAIALLAGACGSPPVIDQLPPDRTCRRTQSVGPAEGDPVEWRVPTDPVQVPMLNPWCAAVGPALVGGWSEEASDPPVADSLAVVAWNVHVGSGHLPELVADLRSGALTRGRPVTHFVLLLQESHRAGDAVPEYDATLPGGSPVRDPPLTGPRQDIVQQAEALGLSLVYAPSMRNGAGEDRGNAILSTIRLEDPIAIELPVARQRRVAVAAEVEGRTTGGVDWEVQVVTVHLESDVDGLASDEQARLGQVLMLLGALPDGNTAVAAGDFNTWTRGRDEALVAEMLRAYPQTAAFPAGPTYRRAFGLVRRYLDYMFFRLPEGAVARYQRIPALYNSDHYPLLGWIVLTRERPER